VEDIAEANFRAIFGGSQRVFNIGSGMKTSVNELLKIISNCAGVSIEPIYADPRRGDIRHSCMDITEAVKILGWKPSFNLTEGIAKTLKFYM